MIDHMDVLDVLIVHGAGSRMEAGRNSWGWLGGCGGENLTAETGDDSKVTGVKRCHFAAKQLRAHPSLRKQR